MTPLLTYTSGQRPLETNTGGGAATANTLCEDR
jgi:hypothetical protein